MRRIGALTSRGDSPGMNAAIRAFAHTALDDGWEAFGSEMVTRDLSEQRQNVH